MPGRRRLRRSDSFSRGSQSRAALRAAAKLVLDRDRVMMTHRIGMALALAACFATTANAQEPAPTALAVYPADINLLTSRSQQLFVVQAAYADGITRDVTAKAKASLANAAVAKLDKNVVTPAGDGETQLLVEFGGQKAVVPVKVKDAKVDRAISFKLDVMPIFMRAGCNQGSCHGAARGKDGFRLSLFGFDADGDHYRLTREMPGRRINLSLPEESLLVEKAQGKVPHTGGQRIKPGDQYSRDLIRWLEAKTPSDPATLPTPVSLDIYPKIAVLDGKGETQQMVVRAKYSDGTDRDVT